MNSRPENIGEQLYLAAWQHELRDAHGRWVKDPVPPVSMQQRIAEHLAKVPGRFARADGQAGKPAVGVKMISDHGNVVGTVVATGGLVAEIDADDGSRYHIDWRDGVVLKRVALSEAPPVHREPAAPGVQASAVHEPIPPAEYGQGSEPVRMLRELFSNGELVNGDAKDEDQPIQGVQGDTEIVTLSDGSKVVFKSQDPERNDREELSYYVSQALAKATGHDPGLPSIARSPDTPWEMVERTVPGVTAARYYQEHAGKDWANDDYRWSKLEEDLASSTPSGRSIGLLDKITSNSDRNWANYLIDSHGKAWPIDMGMAQFDGDDYGSPFWDNSDQQYAPAEITRIEAELARLQPEFKRLDHEDWYVVMMNVVSRLQDSPAGPATLGAQLGISLAVELATGGAWLHELRDAHGEWTRTPTGKVGTGVDRYAVPPHERLVNPKADHPDPADYPFFQKHPVSADNVIAAYDAVPKEMREAGMHWYHDAFLLSRALAHGDAEKGAILLANYSPQANWPINMFRAARVADENKPIPAGEGYINNDQVKKAQRALDGEKIDQVLISPKTRSFAHLLANGDDSPDDPYGHVVVDAHALNVAAGGDIRGATYQSNEKRKKLPPEDLPPIGSDVRAHEYVGDMYRQAASYISHRDGMLVKPHQLQAVTWVAQVLANQAEDRAVMAQEGSAKGRLSARAKDWARWLAYAQGHHLALIPGVSALANSIAVQAFEADLEMAGDDSLFAQLVDLAAWEHELRDSKGRWARGSSIGAQIHGIEPGVTTTLPPGQPRTGRRSRVRRAITAAEARGNSRPVSMGEFQHLAAIGNSQLDKRKRDASAITGLDDHWDAIKRDSYLAVQQNWGGKTVNAHTGTALKSDADRYALSVKPPRISTVSVPEHATEAEFQAAMDRAKELFRQVLQRRDYHLGVFHDDDHHRIDIDPVLVVDTPHEVETIGAYAHSVGGAYHFRTGDGYWPPHVAEGADMAEPAVHWAGPGQWLSYANDVQDPEPTDDSGK